MNKHKISILGITLLMLTASCKKTDVLQKEQAKNTDAVSAKSTAVAGVEWNAPSTWTAAPATGFTIYSTSITDASITNEVLQNGMVLVYMNDGKGVKSLPFKTKEGVEQYWYYQAAKNSLQINSDAYTTEAISITNSFKYFVLTKEKITELQKSGTSKMHLMTLTYENAEMLLK